VEEICKIGRQNVPLIVVFTKYDMLVTSFIQEIGEDELEQFGDEEEIWSHGKEKAHGKFKTLCIDPLIDKVGEVPFIKVSTNKEFKSTVEELIQVTDKQVLQSVHGSSHSTPESLAWATAQRGNPDVSIEASIDVGRERYWKGLISSTDFTGKKLRQCLDVIHTDIILVWNIRDPHNYLAGEKFKAAMSRLVEDLLPPPRTSVSGQDLVPVGSAFVTASTPFGIIVASIWSAALFARWVHDVYRSVPDNVACVMGYIVDLTIVMRKLSNVALDISKESIESALKEFTEGDITHVHHDIRKFLDNQRTVSLANKDSVLGEIINLIHMYCGFK